MSFTNVPPNRKPFCGLGKHFPKGSLTTVWPKARGSPDGIGYVVYGNQVFTLNVDFWDVDIPA